MDPFRDTPLHNLVKPSQNQPIFLAIFHEAKGGQQDRVINIGKTRSSLTYVGFLMRQLEIVLEDAKQVSPEIRGKLVAWIHYTRNTSALLNSARRLFSSWRPNKDIKNLQQLAKQIESQLRVVRSFSTVLKNRLKLQPSNLQASDLILQLEDTTMGLPTSFRLTLTGEEVTQKLHGFSIFVLGSVCVKRVCLDAINITVDDFIEDHCLAKRDPAVALYLKGVVTKSTPLGFGLSLPRGGALALTIQRESDTLAALLEAEVHFLGLRKRHNVTLDGDKISFEAEGRMFGRHEASLGVQAKIHSQDLTGLTYHVTGKLRQPSPVAAFLEDEIGSIIKSLAEKSQRKLQETLEAVTSGTKRKEEAEKLFVEKTQGLLKAKNTFQTKERNAKKYHLNYAVAKTEFNASLANFVHQGRGVCVFKSCNYTKVDVCVPKVCQKKVTTSYNVPICHKEKEAVEVHHVGRTTTWRYEMKKTYTRKHWRTCLRVLWFFTCYTKTVWESAPPVRVPVPVPWNFFVSRTQIVDKIKCRSSSVTDDAGFGQPEACCENDKVDVLDQKCVAFNIECTAKNTKLKTPMRSENLTLFESFQKMTRYGERANLAQLELNKARIQLEFALKQHALAKARFDQQKYAATSINITAVAARERLGLELGEEIKKHGVTRLVKVQSLGFEADVHSAEQTVLPFSISVQTLDGKQKTPKARLDFHQLEASVENAANNIVMNLYGDRNSRRKRRSTDQLAQFDGNTTVAGGTLGPCIFSKDSNIYFTEILDSLGEAVRSFNVLASEMEKGRKGLEDPYEVNSAAKATVSPTLGKALQQNSKSMGTAYDEIIQILRQEQMSSSAPSWEETLQDWRGFLEIFTAKKNFSDCSGTHDCIGFFFDELWEMYEVEDDTEALEIKSNLVSLEGLMSNLTSSNCSLAEAVTLISEIRTLLNKTKDDDILCGTEPEIRRSTPKEIIALIGEKFTLSCEVISKTRVKYLWWKNGEVLQTKPGNSSITFYDISPNDAGAYNCEASNKRGKTVSNVTIVRVHSRPSMTAEPQDVTTKDTSTEMAFFVCNATGTPEPTVQWY